MVTGVIYKYTANSVGTASTNISACCRGKVRTIKGYKWRYKNGNI